MNYCNISAGEEDWLVEDATFDCNSLSSCDTTCEGPQRDKIHKATKECGCMIEWFVHSAWMKIILSLVVYILMNVSRMAFLDGLARVLWEKLHPGTFTVWTTCNRDGFFLTQAVNSSQSSSDVSQSDKESKSTQKQIQIEIERRVRLYRISGFVIMLGGIMLNIPWILIIIQATDRTKPKWLFG